MHTGLSILQNGKLPQFVPVDVIDAIFDVNSTLYLALKILEMV